MADEGEIDGSDFTFNLIAVIVCIACGACAAGLTMGLLSLDGLKLKVKVVTGSEEEKKSISRLLPILEDHHFLLCVLLLFNALANEAMPLFLDHLVPSWAAVIVSVTLVLLFGEILPTAIFSGPSQIQIVSSFVPLVRLLMFVFYPVARPLASLLDIWLGEENDEDDYYSREELAAMVRILRSKGAAIPYTEKAEVISPMYENKKIVAAARASKGRDDGEDSDSDGDTEEEPLTPYEVNVITGVLGLAKISILDVLTPLDQVDMLSDSQVLDEKTITAVVKAGHSRLPVFKGSNRKNIIGVFRSKLLIDKDPEDALGMNTFNLRAPLVVGAGQSPLTVLNLFQQGHSHMAMVSHDPAALLDCIKRGGTPSNSFEPVGIITLEDIIEAMLQSQIYDEDDVVTAHGDHAVASSELYKLSMSTTTSPMPAAQGTLKGREEDESLDPLPQKPPSLLKSLSDSFKFGSQRRASEGDAVIKSREAGRITKGVSAGAVRGEGESTQLTAPLVQGQTPNYSSVEEGTGGTGGGGGGGQDAKVSLKSQGKGPSENATFYKSIDGMVDSNGNLLIPSQDGAHRLQVGKHQTGDLAESNRYGKTLSKNSKWRKITPSLVNKYVTKGHNYKVEDDSPRGRSQTESAKGSRSAKM